MGAKGQVGWIVMVQEVRSLGWKMDAEHIYIHTHTITMFWWRVRWLIRNGRIGRYHGAECNICTHLSIHLFIHSFIYLSIYSAFARKYWLDQFTKQSRYATNSSIFVIIIIFSLLLFFIILFAFSPFLIFLPFLQIYCRKNVVYAPCIHTRLLRMMIDALIDSKWEEDGSL